MQDILTTFLNIIIAIVLFLLKLVLAPIDFLLQAIVPGLSGALTSVGDYFYLATTYIGWILDSTGIPYIGFGLIAAYYTFKLTLPLNLFLIKLAISWYKTLKP